MDEEKLREKYIDGESIFKGKIMNVRRDIVELPNGNRASRELLRHNGAVGIVALDDNNNVCVERQYRYPIDEVITEIPAGKLDTPDEDRLSAAKRELREETGITAKSWEFLGTYYPAAAYSDERITLYLARDLELGDQMLDDDEFLNMTFVPFEEVYHDVMDDKVPDGKTQVAVLKAYQKLNQ